MRKPAELRAVLTSAVPALAQNPDRLHVFVDQGRIVCTGTRSLSHEFRYTLNIVVQDYQGEEQAILLPILAWARRAQSDLFENPERQEQGIEIEVEILTHDTCDISIKLPLTERVIVREEDHTQRLVARYVAEPEHPDLPSAAGRWDIHLRDEPIGGFEYPAWAPKP